jgi:hypothetical protein
VQAFCRAKHLQPLDRFDESFDERKGKQSKMRGDFIPRDLPVSSFSFASLAPTQHGRVLSAVHDSFAKTGPLHESLVSSSSPSTQTEI